ncbi:protein of unknown function [Pseudomonas sp. JV551A1]|uniref:Uncharacterized protein n=1 Tax=Pseudomonas inefficax TaxID=2078786 RepID=A0AAQ1SUR8_9PSED|nr:protein of unknown function [Pseudomonas sp. JV551A1]SPO62066.1 protein of unknown function [Pseudomonas inefficax]
MTNRRERVSACMAIRWPAKIQRLHLKERASVVYRGQPLLLLGGQRLAQYSCKSLMLRPRVCGAGQRSDTSGPNAWRQLPVIRQQPPAIEAEREQ